MKFKHMRVVFCLLLVLSTIVGVFQVSAQQQAGTLQTTRQQLAGQLYQAGVGLLASYNIPASALDELLPFVAQNDQAGLQAALAGYGLSDDQIGSLLNDAAPLIQQGMSTGIIQEYVAGQALAQAQELGVPEDELDEFMRLAQDSEAMAEFLSELGLDDDSISAFLDDYSELHDLGLNAAAYDYFIQVGVFLSLLEEAGLTPDDLLDYMMAFENDDDALNALLEDAGIDPDDFFAAFDEAYFETYAALGFSDDELVSFQDAVFLDLLAMAGDDEEMLAELLESYGFSDDDIDLFITAMEDPEAMAALLGEMGFDPEMIEMYDDANDTSDDTSGGGDGSGSGGGDGSGSGGGDDSGGDDGDGDDGGDDSGGSDDSGGTTGG